MTLTELSIKRPTLIVVIFAALAVLGVFGFSQLKYELLPKINTPFVTITTVYPGASPDEVETAVTKVDRGRGLGDRQDLDRPQLLARGGLLRADRVRPDGGRQHVAPGRPAEGERDPQPAPEGRQSPGDHQVRARRAPRPPHGGHLDDGIPGVLPVRQGQDTAQALQARRGRPDHARGGDEREIRVNIDAAKLRSYGLSILQVAKTIKSANLDFPTGKIKEGENQYVVRLAGKFTSIDDLRQLVVGRTRQGGDITARGRRGGGGRAEGIHDALPDQRRDVHRRSRPEAVRRELRRRERRRYAKSSPGSRRTTST